MVIKPELLGEFYSLDLREWIHVNLDGDCRFPRDSDHWDIMFGYLLWNLWIQRNSMIFDTDKVYHEPILTRCSRLVAEVLSSNTQRLPGSAVVGAGREHHRLRRWIPPPNGWVTCNADGSFRAVPGGQHVGVIGIFSTVEAELWGIYECLKYAWELGVTRLRMESDCGRAIQTLQDRGVRHSISLVHHIWDFLDRQWEIHLLVINRESNMVAEALANLAWTLSFEFRDFVHPPTIVLRLLMTDLHG
ncbi:hypothetical protein GQ457_09G024250 [Hibiscus cannabinus]